MADQGREQTMYAGGDAGEESSGDSGTIQSDPGHEPSPASSYQPLLAATDDTPPVFSSASRYSRVHEVNQPSIPQQERIIRVPVSPIKKLVAQQFLNNARNDLKALAEEKDSSKFIPDPAVVLRSSRKKRDDRAVKRTLGPAKDAKEVLVDLMKEVDRKDTAQSGNK